MTQELNDQRWIETYKSLINLSIEGFKFCALANGGAVVALLAYLGNVAGKGATPPDMRLAMASFLVGVTACGLAMLFAYITQLTLFNEHNGRQRQKLTHGWLLWCAIGLTLLSILAFGVGSWLAVIRFS